MAKWFRLGLLWICALGVLAGANVNYILEVTIGTDGAAMAARYGMTVNLFVPEDVHWAYLVSSPVALDATALNRLKQEKGFLELESDAAVSTVEADARSRAAAAPISPRGSTAAI